MELMDGRGLDRTFDTYGEAVREVSEAYRRGFETAQDLRDHNLSLTKDWYEKVSAEFQRRIESNRAMSAEFVEKVLEQRETYQTFVEDSFGTWLNLYFAPFGDFRRNLAIVEEAVDEISDATLEVVDSSVAAVEEAVSAAETFPVADYDDLNVEQVKAKVEGLSAASIRTLRDHEKRNKNRETLITFFDRKLRAKSA